MGTTSVKQRFFYDYCLHFRSLKDGIWYTGMCIDVTKRLNEHNSGRSKFTKGHAPWKIIYTEQHFDWQTARVKEKYFKTAAGKAWVKRYFESEGSLPA